MMVLGGIEILVLSMIIGAILGYFFRDKSKNVKPIVGVGLGALGALIVGYVLVMVLFKSYIAMPVYAIFGSWLFNFIFAKMK